MKFHFSFKLDVIFTQKKAMQHSNISTENVYIFHTKKH